MRELNLRAIYLLSALILAMGFAATGCKKDTPTTEQQPAPQTTTQEEADKEKEFLADPDVVICELEEIPLEKLNSQDTGHKSFLTMVQGMDTDTVKQGRLTLAGRQFGVILGKNPKFHFDLYDFEKKHGAYWFWALWSLHGHHRIDDKLYDFLLVEDGAKLAARPYRGEFGTIKVGDGGRDLEKMEFYGSVVQAGSVSVPIGTLEQGRPHPVSESQLPVGDYAAYNLHVNYGTLSFTLSNSRYPNVKDEPGLEDGVYGMHIRKDEPFVLDFSNEPTVIFQEPAEDKTSFSRGAEVKFAALLIDAELDIKMLGLIDKSVQIEKERSNGTTYKTDKSLNPTVVIARADGEIVAEGVMPFG